KIGGKGLFVKEIEDALLRKEVDLAVHSIKDVPAELPDGLILPVYPEREDPRDAFISCSYTSLGDLPAEAKIGTGSLRRSSQILNMRPDIQILPLRGNVDTRLNRLETGEMDAVILAAAGLNRLGLSGKITELIPADTLLPAIGQGALGLEIRKDDNKTLEILSFLNHRPTELAVRAERALLKRLEGGCQVPIAGFAVLEGASIILKGMVAELDGSLMIKDEIRGPEDRPEELGTALAERLLIKGADRILEGVYGNKTG
ncbi:MAG: hydroxymethylbilane synthase, partial [Deltaproteobacteria bacterium]|nr:hydroxymethylbilane synthase [Deltaproteobacteria bacterium]